MIAFLVEAASSSGNPVLAFISDFRIKIRQQYLGIAFWDLVKQCLAFHCIFLDFSWGVHVDGPEVEETNPDSNRTQPFVDTLMTYGLSCLLTINATLNSL